MIRTEVRSLCVECAGRNVRRQVASGTPVVTYGLIGISVALFLLSWISTSTWELLAFNPIVGYFQPWRFLTTAFLHSGIMHLLFNMLALYFVGQSLEAVLGRWQYLTVYLLSAVGGTLAVLVWALFQPSTFQQVTVGASGAVFGLFAAIFVVQKRSGIDTRAVVGLLAVNFLYGLLLPNVSWQAHLGGLLTGLFATWVLTAVAAPRPHVTARKQMWQSIGAALAIALAMVGLVALTYRLILEATLA